MTTAVLIALVALGSFGAGWWARAQCRPDALAIGDAVNIVHGTHVVGRMVLVQFNDDLYAGKTATLVDQSRYVEDRRL